MSAPRTVNLEPPPCAHLSETVGFARGVCSQLPTRLGWVTADARSSVCRELDLVLVPG
jgi:hypothetical protein